MDLSSRRCWAKSLPMPSKVSPIRFWKNFAGAQKCVREAQQMLRVSTASMIKQRDDGFAIADSSPGDSPVVRQIRGAMVGANCSARRDVTLGERMPWFELATDRPVCNESC